MSTAKGALCAVCLLHVAVAAAAQSLTTDQQADFLRTARIVSAAPIGKGVTRPFRLTLTDGSLTHDAAFQSVDEKREMARTGRGSTMELNFVDSWRFNIAAHHVAALLGIADMVPVSVQRSWNGKVGALTWWVDDVLMDEEERRKTGAEPPNREEWGRQQLRMRVFTQLVYDTDRNQGNTLITRDWRLVMIDFSRAFRSWKKLRDPLTTLPRCDRRLFAAMRTLTKESVQRATGDHLMSYEIEALLARRDILVKHFDGLVARRGEATVLY
jgi:hypothetical protein